MKTRPYLITVLLASGLGAPLSALAQQLDWQWTVRLATPPSTSVFGYAGAVGSTLLATADGGVVVSGGFERYLAFGAGPGDTLRANVQPNSRYELGSGFLLKYSAGGQRQWAVSAGSNGVVTSFGKLLFDAQRNYYCVVYHDATLPTPGGGSLPGRGIGWFRYSPAGTFLGAGELTQDGGITGLSLDLAGNTTISGTASPSTIVAGQPIGSQNIKAYVAKIGSGGAAQWVRPLITNGDLNAGMRIYEQAVLPNGDVLIGGSFSGNILLDASPGHQFVASGGLGFLACYNGSTGAVRWARTVSVPVHPLVDATSGQAYVAGEFTTTLNLDGVAPVANGVDVFIARLDATTGLAQSLVFAGGGPGNQRIGALEMQPDGSFLLSGSGSGGASFGSLSLPNTSPTAFLHYLVRVGAQGSTSGLYELPGGLFIYSSPVIDPSGNPFALVTTTTQPVRFGQSAAFTPTGQGEVVLAHVGLVLGTKKTGAAAIAFSVYPNPSAPAAPVHISSSWPEATVRVRDVLGRQLWQGRLRQGQAIISAALTPGLYSVEVSNGAQRAAQRLVVQ